MTSKNINFKRKKQVYGEKILGAFLSLIEVFSSSRKIIRNDEKPSVRRVLKHPFGGISACLETEYTLEKLHSPWEWPISNQREMLLLEHPSAIRWTIVPTQKTLLNFLIIYLYWSRLLRFYVVHLIHYFNVQLK